MMIVVAQKGESHPAAAVSSKLFSGMLDGRRTEYRHDNQPTDHVCIDPRGGVRACRPPRENREREREREKGKCESGDETRMTDACRGREKAFERGKGEFGRGASL